MAQKKGKMKSSDLRDANKQKQYREEHKAKNKKDQHVAHYVSLRIANYLNTFVDPPIPVPTLKQLCNHQRNFRMVKAKTNLSTHNRIDNDLINSFKNVMLPKINEDPIYKKLLMTNPCKLEKLMRENKVTCFILNGNQRLRVKAQTKRLQELPFPSKYLAFARLFYRCFRAKRKGNKKHLVQIWDDRENSEEFKRYLKNQQELMVNDSDSDENSEQIGNVIPSENRMDDEEEQLNVDDDADHKDEEKKETENDDIITPKNHKDKMLDKQYKGRQLYIGRRGAIFYKTKSGNKVYVKNTPSALPDGDAEKVVHDHKEQKSEENQLASDVNENTINIISNQDSKGTEPSKEELFVENYLKEQQKLIGNAIESENTTDDQEEQLMKDDVDHNDEEKEETENDKMLDKQYKGKKLFVGKRGATYYKTKSGNKVYVKNTPGASSDNDVEKVIHDDKKQKSEEKKSASDPNETAMISNQDSKESIPSKEESCVKTKNDISNEDKKESIGVDDKGRTLYKGKKGGVYYKTKSGNKVYIKTKTQ